jgi:HSP20 family protein
VTRFLSVTIKNRLEKMLARFTAAQWAPVTGVVETKDALLIDTELPGLTEKDIQVQIEGGILTISGERSIDKKVEEDDFRRIERSDGKFVRRFTLPPTWTARRSPPPSTTGCWRSRSRRRSRPSRAPSPWS